MIGKKINQLATELAPVSTDLTIIGDPDSGVSKKITLAQLGAIFSGAVSFYTNLASFPAVGDINVIYCAKDTQKLYLWSGSAYVEVFPSQALLDTYQLRSEKGNANGYASLDSQGKVPITQLPSSIMEYKGTWNAATNTPTLANGTGDTGDVYICNVAGTVNFGAGPITFAVGDYVIYSGTIWQRSSGAVGTVTSVGITESGDALTITGSPITTSGTINIGFAGANTQYVRGDGTLATFPSIISQAQNLVTEVYNKTGATLTKGTVVYINGGQGNLPTITKALASGDSTSAQTYGIVQNDITNNNNGYVVVAGRLSDIDTQAFTEGTQLYLSSTTAGAYTSTKQYAPNHLVYVGIIVRSHPTQGIIEVKIQNGYELDELHNVAAQTPTNNDGLFWESATSLWKNKSIATILGGTPVTGSGNVNAIPKFTANSVLGNSVMEDDGNFVSMRGLKINAVAGVGNTINFQQGSGITAAGLGYSTIGAASTTGFVFYIDQNTTSRSFILDTSTITSATQLTYSLPASSGTLALVSQLTGGTVTSVGLSVPTGFAVSGSPVTSSGTLALAFDTGYSLPTIVKQNNWDTAYNTRIVTASSPLSFISNTISISQASGSANGFLSSTDWTTFNNKQNALTNPVTGTGTTNYLPKFTGTSTIGNSQIFDNGSNVGINRNNPTRTLDILGGTGIGTVLKLEGASGTTTYLQLAYNGATNSQSGYIGYNSSSQMQFFTNDTLRATLDASGNLGLGVTPSAWMSGSTALQVVRGGLWHDGSGYIAMFNNAYYDGSNWRYIASTTASNYAQVNGNHQWFQAPSGTAGNAISFTQAMTLDASGNLGLGTTSPSYKLDVTGVGRFLSGSSSTIGLIVGGAGGAGSTRQGQIRFGDAGTVYKIQGGEDYSAINFIIGSTTVLGLASSGAATFSSSVTAGGFLVNGSTTITSPIDTGSTKAYFDASSINGAALTLRSDSVGRTIRLISDGSGTTTAAIDCNSTGLGIGTNTNHPILFTPNATERMRITSGGNVVIGNTVASNVGLTIYGSNAATIYQTANTGTGAGNGFYVGHTGDISYIWNYNNYPTVFGTNNTERMRIKSSGIINLSNVPSSSAGLSSGDIYSSAGVLMIV